MQVKKLNLFRGDKTIWLSIILLSLIGLIMAYSASVNNDILQEKNFLTETAFIFIAGFVIMIAVKTIRLDYIKRWTKLYLVAALLFPLLDLLFFNGACNGTWINITGTFKVSELVILFATLFIGYYLSNEKIKITDKPVYVVLGYIIVLAFIMLISLTNFSASVLFSLVCAGLLLFSKLSIKKKVIYASTFIILLVAILFWFASFRGGSEAFVDRVGNCFQHTALISGSDFWLNESVEDAVSSGIPFGKGVAESTYANVIPNAYSDFVFVVIIEEYGILGGVLVLLLFILLLYRTFSIAIKNRGGYKSMLLFGFSLLIGLHAFFHIMISLNVFPVTSIQLPLISIDGYSTLFMFLILGIIFIASDEAGNAPDVNVKKADSN